MLGLGTDVGGSLRIPAHFSGICGFKPTNGRLYEDGRIGAVGAGMATLRCGVYSVAGFMSPHVAGIQVGMKSLLQSSRKMSARDWRVVPVDWNDELYRPGRKLKLAYYEEDGIFPPTPGARRALKVRPRLRRSEVTRPDTLGSAGLSESGGTRGRPLDPDELCGGFCDLQ